MEENQLRQKGKKVVVGLSGGVDSSVTAAILKGQGYDVRAVFLLLWNEDEKKNSNSLADAKKVAQLLEIDLEIIDVRDKFLKEVVGYFLEEYKRGRTPNPCIFCNENLKFKVLFRELEKVSGDFVATGHYARIIMEHEKYKLLQAKDNKKDQSYFLYRLNQERLSKLLFPIGEYEKLEIRKMAEKFGLPVFDKDESQNICFLSDDNVNRFIREKISMKEGDIIDQNGRKIGKHCGLSLYTLGQRKGINIGGTGPYYVYAKDYEKNVLSVTNNPLDNNLHTNRILLEKVSWVSDEKITPMRVLVKTRYQQKAAYAIINRDKGGYFIVFEKPEKLVAPGQSVVFYSGEQEVLGGGIVKK
jgi:tRNA-specific 2-thiouridylase